MAVAKKAVKIAKAELKSAKKALKDAKKQAKKLAKRRPKTLAAAETARKTKTGKPPDRRTASKRAPALTTKPRRKSVERGVGRAPATPPATAPAPGSAPQSPAEGRQRLVTKAAEITSVPPPDSLSSRDS
jgi:hypothetical protein